MDERVRVIGLDWLGRMTIRGSPTFLVYSLRTHYIVKSLTLPGMDRFEASEGFVVVRSFLYAIRC